MTFQSFDSMEDMYEAMRIAEETANGLVTDEQRQIGWGDCWLSIAHDIVIWGRIWTMEELLASEKKAGATKADLRSMEIHETEMFARGYRFGKAYSIVVAEGELGSTHISTMVPIHEKAFDIAQDCHWDIEDYTRAFGGRL